MRKSKRSYFYIFCLSFASEWLRKSTMHVHDTKATGWDLGLESRPGNGLELSITSHEDLPLGTGFMVNCENFLKPQIYQTHNKDTL